MTVTRRISYLLSIMVAIAVLPWLGSWIHFDGAFPPDFFDYPPTEPFDKRPFSWPVFVVVAIVFLIVACLYIFPKRFGFKKVAVPLQEEVSSVRLPVWFWVGLVLWGVTLVLLWTKSTGPIWLLHWSDVPLYWGFALMIDGWVYVRTGGKSLVSEVPQELIGIGVASVTGWMVFEWLNYFVEDNWYYPFAKKMGGQARLLYAIFTSSALLPLAFEWYSLFNTFPAFKQRFSRGIPVVCPEWLKTTLLVLGLASLIAAGLFPDQLFFVLWMSPPVLLAVGLDKIGVWTPLRSIGQGNWSPTLLFALTYLVEGFLLEFQNYFSSVHAGSYKGVFSEAPLYWQYAIPYVNAFHIFEMPVLGYAGYLPFGVYCWLWWIAWASLLGIPSKFYEEEPFV